MPLTDSKKLFITTKNTVGTFYITLPLPRWTFWMFLGTRMSPIAMYI